MSLPRPGDLLIPRFPHHVVMWAKLGVHALGDPRGSIIGPALVIAVEQRVGTYLCILANVLSPPYRDDERSEPNAPLVGFILFDPEHMLLVRA